MRRFFWICILLILGACAAGENEDVINSSPETARSEKTIVSFASGFSPRNEMLDLISDYNKNSDVYIKYQELSQNPDVIYNKLKTDEFDIITLKTEWIPEFSETGRIIPLDLDSDFLDSARLSVTHDSKTWAAPASLNAGLFYWSANSNASVSIVEILTSEIPPEEFAGYEIIFPIPTDNLEEPARILLEMYRALEKNGYAAASAFLRYNSGYYTGRKITALLSEGKTPFIRSALIPSGENFKISAYGFTRVRGVAYAISQSSRNKEAARDFIDYLTTPRNQKYLAGNNFPASKSVLDDKFYIVSDLAPEVQSPDFYLLNENLKNELRKLTSGEISIESFAYWLENESGLE
jgi:ABC-type glycerol-3-phosphate transport system substrate-binding protein